MRNFFSSSRPWRLGAIVAAAAFFACQQKSPEEKLLKKIEPAGSWVATLQMTGEKWNANSVPTSFVRTSAGAARKAFDKASKEAAKAQANPALRAAARELIGEAQAAAAGLQSAVAANDRAAVARLVGRLAALQGRFERLTQGG